MPFPVLSPDDIFTLKLALYREAEGEPADGQMGVAMVILNGAAKRRTSVYTEVTRPARLTGMTGKGDPRSVVWPSAMDVVWGRLGAMVAAIATSGAGLLDPTGGSTMYYAPKGLRPQDTDPVPYTLPDGTQVPFPRGWDRRHVRFQVRLGNQLFFTEV